MKSLILILFFLIPSLLFAQNKLKESTDSLENISILEPISETIPTDFSIFEEDTPVDIVLKYDISSFIKNKKKGEYIDAELTVYYTEDQSVTKNIRLKARGNFRRGYCFFPPIHLNFKTDKIKNKELKGTRKIKLVTHCSNSKANELYILKEYLVYKLYNVLSDKSFRVRLLNINYVDTGKKQRNYQNYGFLIEPLDLVAKRQNSVLIDPTVVRENNVIEEDADRVALFNYMIGNTDWRIKGGHNIRYLKQLDVVNDKVIAVPYDFDFAGFVGTSYSHPQEWTSIENVKQREYLGYCRNNDIDYLNPVNYFNSKKKEILDVIEKFEYLSDREKKSLTNYILEFYSESEKPDKFIYYLKNQCRTDF